MADMKAYIAYDIESCECGSAIVFAENATKAKLAAMATDCCEDAKYINIRVHRLKQADHLYKGKAEIDWYDMNTRMELVKDFGWSCYEPSWECDTCPAKLNCRHWEEV